MAWLKTANDEQLLDLWPGSAQFDPATVAAILTAARSQIASFAPAIPDADNPPSHYVIAQAMQALAIARSLSAGSGDQLGVDGIAVTVYPMDWSVKMLLRPPRAPVVA